jgi:LacI family transcriptional regulator
MTPRPRPKPFAPPRDPLSRTPSEPDGRRRSPTILDLAREAGVSKTTVSRVLNDSPKVADETEERVRKAMKSLGFQVNLAARSLRTTRSALVGLLVPTIDNEIFGRVAQTLTTELAGSDVGLVISTSNWDSGAELRALRALAARGVDALALSLVNDRYPDVVEFVHAFDRPIVLLDRQVRGQNADAVVTDQRPGLTAAIAHLHELGHRDIGLITLPNRTHTTRGITVSYQAACRRLGLQPRREIAERVDMSSGAESVDRLVADGIRAIVVCAPSLILAGALERLDTIGLKVPTDVSIVGYDESPVAFATRPRLTVISRDIDAISQAASRMIVTRLSQPGIAPRLETVLTELRIRDSTGPAPALAAVTA